MRKKPQSSDKKCCSVALTAAQNGRSATTEVAITSNLFVWARKFFFCCDTACIHPARHAARIVGPFQWDCARPQQHPTIFRDLLQFENLFGGSGGTQTFHQYFRICLQLMLDWLIPFAGVNLYYIRGWRNISPRGCVVFFFASSLRCSSEIEWICKLFADGTSSSTKHVSHRTELTSDGNFVA